MSAFASKTQNTLWDSPLLLLLLTGSLLAVTVILSQLAGSAGASMLWYLAVVMLAAGALLLGGAIWREGLTGPWTTRLGYSLGAGGFQAVTMGLAFTSVNVVGVGYVSLAFALPLLVTYLLALLAGMERFQTTRAIGVVLALSGGLLIATAKFTGISASGQSAGWILAASAIPFVIAGGNLYRTRFWPGGASPRLLAGLMLFLAGLLIGALAVATEGPAGLAPLMTDPHLLLFTGLNIAAFAIKFVVYFRLQQVAGPVYLSQIGAVGAVVATPIAVWFLGETLPEGFLLAVLLIVLGAGLFQLGARSLWSIIPKNFDIKKRMPQGV